MRDFSCNDRRFVFILEGPLCHCRYLTGSTRRKSRPSLRCEWWKKDSMHHMKRYKDRRLTCGKIRIAIASGTRWLPRSPALLMRSLRKLTQSKPGARDLRGRTTNVLVGSFMRTKSSNPISWIPCGFCFKSTSDMCSRSINNHEIRRNLRNGNFGGCCLEHLGGFFVTTVYWTRSVGRTEFFQV